MSAYEKVLLARAKDRPTGLSYIENIFEDFIELHGDRRFADDPAIVGGIATLKGQPVTVIAIDKGKDMRERVKRNFGSPNPEGYRKALRLMRQAEKFHRPVVCFVDTAGAFCGMGAEERGQGQAIAENLLEMSGLKTPIVSILVGEGGSGGALALAALGVGFGLAQWPWRWPTRCGFWRTRCTLSSPPRAAPASCGRTRKR